MNTDYFTKLSNASGYGTFDNPIQMGGTVRDQYGRDVLHSFGRKYGQSYTKDQDLERQRIMKRDGMRDARVSTANRNTSGDVEYSEAVAQALLAKWRRGYPLDGRETDIVMRYMESNANENQLGGAFRDVGIGEQYGNAHNGYVRGTGNTSSWIGNPVEVETAKDKRMTDSTKFKRYSGKRSETLADRLG